MSDLLFGRYAVITIDNLEIPCGTDGLMCTFKIEKTLSTKPNTADIEIVNLSPDHQAEIIAKAQRKRQDGSLRGVRVKIEAGYTDNICRVFEGDLRYAWTTVDGPDTTTHLESGDGEFFTARSLFSKGYAAGTPIATVVKDLARSLGAGDGNLTKATQVLSFLGGGNTFPQGTAIVGKSTKALDTLLSSCGYSYSCQDGTLQFLEKGKALDTTAVLLDASTGLVGSPALDHKGVLTFETLMIPDLFPGRKVKLDSLFVKGYFVVTKARIVGESHGQQWYIDCEAKALPS